MPTKYRCTNASVVICKPRVYNYFHEALDAVEQTRTVDILQYPVQCLYVTNFYVNWENGAHYRKILITLTIQMFQVSSNDVRYNTDNIRGFLW